VPFRLGEVIGKVGAMSFSRGTPVTFAVASFTSVILPSALIVTSGSSGGFDQAAGIFGGLLLRFHVACRGENAITLPRSSRYTEAL